MIMLNNICAFPRNIQNENKHFTLRNCAWHVVTLQDATHRARQP